MRILFSFLCFGIYSVAAAQSPYLSVRFNMDSLNADTRFSKFNIEMKICEPMNRTEKGDWFSSDTSDIAFSKLTAAEISCGKYMVEGEGIEVLSGEKIAPHYNSYKFSNQRFAWEHILIFRISNRSSAGLQPPMYVIVPIKYKSFVTSVSIADVTYKSGNVIFIDNATATFPNKRLTINHSLKSETGIRIEGSSFSSWVED